MVPALRTPALLAASFVLLVSSGSAQVTVCTDGDWTTGTTHSAGTGDDRLLVVAVGGESSSMGTNDYTAVSYGGQSLTLLERIETSATSTSYVGSLWYLGEAGIAAATSSTIDVTVTGPGFTDTSVAAVTYCNVDQANPVGNVATLEGSGGSAPDPIVTSISIDAMHAGVAAAGCGNSGSFTWAEDLVEATDQPGSSSTFSTADMASFGSADTRTSSAEFSGTVNRNVLLLAEIRDAQPLPTFGDGSFEQQTPGAAPAAPWSITAGSSHLINPSGVASDGALPTDGSNWAEVGTVGTNAATPPSNPGGAGSPPSGAAGISQSFTYDPGNPHLFFHAAFVLGGPAADASFNDFMSVDVTDGSTSVNLYHADSFSNFPNTSVKYGLPMTSVDAVVANLSALFPTADASTVFTVTAQVGNGGDDQNESGGYVDNFGFGPDAASIVRNGMGVNPLCLSTITEPALGATWTTRVDHGNHPGAIATVIVARASLISANTSFGELLVGGVKLLKNTELSSGTFDDHSLPVPVELMYQGLTGYVQAVIIGGAGPELCNALELQIGF